MCWLICNEFPLIFQKVQHSHFRHQKTTSNLLRINLKGILKVQWNMATRGSYVHNCYGRIFGGIPKMLILCNFLRKFMASDEKIHRAFRTHTTVFILKQNPLDKFFIFTIYQNYTLALKCSVSVDRHCQKFAIYTEHHTMDNTDNERYIW